MACVLQCLDGLEPDRVRRHQPQHHRPVLLDPGVARDGDGMRAEDRLAPAGRKPQADIRHGRQFGERPVSAGMVAETSRLLRLSGDRLVRTLRPGDTCLLKEPSEDRQSLGLVLLQLHQSRSRLDVVGRLPEGNALTGKGRPRQTRLLAIDGERVGRAFLGEAGMRPGDLVADEA